MNSDIEVLGMAPLIYEFMGKKRKLRNMTVNEDIDLEVITVELNNIPAPSLKRSRTVEVEETDNEGNVKKVERREEIPLDEAMKTFQKEIKSFKKETGKLREKYLLKLFEDGEISPEEIDAVTIREWNGLRKKLNRQRYYDMGLTDLEIDELEQQAVKAGFQDQDLIRNLL